MRFNHAAYMNDQIHRALFALHHTDEFPVKIMAEMAGCSYSLMSQYVREVQDNYRACYIDALRSALAEKGNYRLIAYLLPPGSSISTEEATAAPNHCIEDEVTDGVIGLAKLAAGHRGKNPDAMSEARGELKEVLVRAEMEEGALRTQQESPKMRKAL